MGFEERAGSEFNEAIGFLNRANDLWYKMHVDRMSMNYASWCDDLISMYVELRSDLPNRDDINRLEITLLKIKSRLSTYQPQKMGTRTIHNPVIYKALLTCEIILRDAWDDAGYKTKRSDDPRFAIGR